MSPTPDRHLSGHPPNPQSPDHAVILHHGRLVHRAVTGPSASVSSTTAERVRAYLQRRRAARRPAMEPGNPAALRGSGSRDDPRPPPVGEGGRSFDAKDAPPPPNLDDYLRLWVHSEDPFLRTWAAELQQVERKDPAEEPPAGS